MGMDYSVLSDLHNMHVWVWAGAFTEQPHRALGLRGWDPPDIQGFLWPTTIAHILGPQPTWPCLINGFERGHILHPVQHVVHVPKDITVC